MERAIELIILALLGLVIKSVVSSFRQGNSKGNRYLKKTPLINRFKVFADSLNEAFYNSEGNIKQESKKAFNISKPGNNNTIQFCYNKTGLNVLWRCQLYNKNIKLIEVYPISVDKEYSDEMQISMAEKFIKSMNIIIDMKKQIPG